MNLKVIAFFLIFCFIAIGMDKPLCCGSTGWASTGWSAPQTYGLPQVPIPGQRGGMNMPRGMTEYYVPNMRWEIW